jgi:hypothetical protein
MALDRTFLEAVTRDKFIPRLKNNVYKKMPLMKRIVEKNMEDASGEKLTWRVVLKRHTALGRFSGYETHTSQQINPIVTASLEYANYFHTVGISLVEEKQNSGNKEKLLDLWDVQFKNADASLREQMYQDLFLSSTSIGGHNSIVGIGAVVDNDNTYAGINRSTAGNEDWKAQITTTAYTVANMKDATHAGYLPGLMRSGWLNASFDGAPNVIVTTPTLYEVYQFIAETNNLRLGGSKADLGFKDGSDLGGVEVVFDKYCTSLAMYGLNTDSFFAKVFPGANFDVAYPEINGGMQRGANQFAYSMDVVWMGQIGCEVPRENFVYTALG